MRARPGLLLLCLALLPACTTVREPVKPRTENQRPEIVPLTLEQEWEMRA